MELENKDVKETQTGTSPVEAAKTDSDTKAQAQEKSNANESENRSIPYSRFKEVLESKKEMEKKLKTTEQQTEQRLADVARQYQTYYESELSKAKRLQESNSYMVEEVDLVSEQQNKTIAQLKSELDSIRTHVSEMKTQTESDRLKSNISKLQDVYPMLDEEHVYVVKKMKPDWSLEECAEHSHKHFEQMINNKYEKMIMGKKEAAKKPVMGDGGKINLKPGERPKNLKEAHKMFLAHMQPQGD